MSDNDFDIIPERDDRRRVSASTTNRRTKEPTASSGGGSSLMVWILTLLLIVALGGIGYLYWNSTQSATRLAMLDDRLQSIERKLSVTDESLSQSGAAMQAVIKEQEEKIRSNLSEIRKLWVIAHQTNSKDIKANKATLATQKQQLASIDTLVKQLEKQLTPAVKQIFELQSSVSIVADESVANTAEIETIQKQLRDLADIANRLQTNLTAQQQLMDSADEQLSAINASRLEVNRRILDLQSQLRELSRATSEAQSNQRPSSQSQQSDDSVGEAITQPAG